MPLHFPPIRDIKRFFLNNILILQHKNKSAFCKLMDWFQHILSVSPTFYPDFVRSNVNCSPRLFCVSMIPPVRRLNHVLINGSILPWQPVFFKCFHLSLFDQLCISIYIETHIMRWKWWDLKCLKNVLDKSATARPRPRQFVQSNAFFSSNIRSSRLQLRSFRKTP